MREVRRALWRWLAPLLVLLPGPVLGAGGGGGEAMVIVADTRAVSGWEAWWGNLYNESMLYFTLVTVITIPVMGVVLGTLTDFFMARIGINLRSRSVGEH